MSPACPHCGGKTVPHCPNLQCTWMECKGCRKLIETRPRKREGA